jgi:hypothetical protein
MQWAVNAAGQYLYAPELSKNLRFSLRALCKMRQFCDPRDGTQFGMKRGATFYWDVIKRVSRQGYRLNELEPIPETTFQVLQNSLSIREYGNSIPYTSLVTSLSKVQLMEIVDKALKDDAARCFDAEAWLQFDATPLTVAPASGNSAVAVTLETGNDCTITNAIAMRSAHIKAISDAMKERNIPAFRDDNFGAVGHPTTFRTFKNDLEAINLYTETGYAKIMRGEIGRYESVRFVEQNNIVKGGAEDSTTFDVVNGVADEWNGAVSSWAFFFGQDTVIEAQTIPVEIRAKIPSDFGRSHGMAWYALGGFGIAHPDALNARIVKWESQA